METDRSAATTEEVTMTWEDVELTLRRVLDDDQAVDAALALREAGFAVLSHDEVGFAIDGVATCVDSSRREAAPLLRKLQGVYAAAPREDDRA